MAGASRLLRTTGALHSDHRTSSSSSSSSSSAAAASSSSRPLKLPWSTGGAKPCSVQLRKRMAVSLGTTVGLPDTKQKPLLQEGIAKVAGDILLRLLNPPKLDSKRWRTRAEMLIEKGVTGCRSFTLMAVAGSIMGSILCFVEGCFFVLEAFYRYFQTISSSMDQGRIIQSLVESIDMFLVGTALLSFGISLYVMFVSSDCTKQKRRRQIAESTFGSFNLKKLAKSMKMQSISDAKSRMGHSVLLILQAGVVEKLKEVELASGMDLACLAGVVFVSSACVFILSKLSITRGSEPMRSLLNPFAGSSI